MAGRVFVSSSAAKPRGRAAWRETREVGSFASPKTMACAGQVWAQAGVTSPSWTLRSPSRASPSAKRMRCTQKVHFSMTPFERTVTSG